jgi:hypothetical protein
LTLLDPLRPSATSHIAWLIACGTCLQTLLRSG